MPIRQRISDPKGFSRRVAELRETKGFTLARLGGAVGVSGTCIWNWENGNTFPKTGALRALAAALETTATYLVEGRDEGSARNGEEGAPPRHSAPGTTRTEGLSIAEAKKGLSRFFGVSEDQIQILING